MCCNIGHPHDHQTEPYGKDHVSPYLCINIPAIYYIKGISSTGLYRARTILANYCMEADRYVIGQLSYLHGRLFVI